MFEGAVAAVLNRLLGRYVEDLDTETFNVGIFSGETFLTDLKLKPEALYQLGLPIRVEIGIIGKVSLKIPWTGLFTQPIILAIEDIYIVAVPVTSGRYNPEIQKRLMRAAKKKVLEDFEGEGWLGPGLPSSILDNLMMSMVKSFQITVNNVHVRYEESFADRNIACGLCIQSFSMATTNNKWKPGVTPITSTSVYQLIRAESLSLYMDPHAEPSLSRYSETWEFSNLLEWKTIMNRSLQIFGMNNKDFQFLVKPFTTKIKVIVNKSTEGQVSRMLVDVVLQDVAMQLSDGQFATLCQLWESYRQGITERSRLHHKSHPTGRVSEDRKSWWRYACNALLEHNIRPYTWEYIKTHRKYYRLYKETYMHTLMRPNDTELKLDLQKYEDFLTTLNIIIAREHAKIDLRKRSPECVTVKACQDSHFRLIVNCEKILDSSMQPASPESKKPFIADSNNDLENKFKLERMPKHFDRKYNFTFANWSLSLLSKDHEILIVTVTQFLASVETRPELSVYKISARAESFVIEGASADSDLIPLVTADNILTGNVFANFLAIDFEKNPSTAEFNYEVTVILEACEVTYHSHAIREIGMFFQRNKAHVKQFAVSVYQVFQSTKNTLTDLFNSIVSRKLRINLKLDVKGPYIVFPELGSLQEGGNILLVDFGRITLKSELQAINVQVEDATLMELEELLYDRLHLVWTNGQVLICHSGDDWRESRKWKDSESHLIQKIQANVTLSCSIKPDYRLLPRMKLNVSFSNLKFNLSKDKLWYVCVFLNQMHLPNPNDIEEFRTSLMRIRKETEKNNVFSSIEFVRVRSIITLASFIMDREKSEYNTNAIPTCTVTESERSVISSEFSEEDLEQWMRSTNLFGLDDNISPHNHVDLLFRIVVGELSFHAVTTFDGREKPYLVLKLCTIYFEAAIMEYGPALQFGVGSIVLADKTNAGITGSYLELISTDGCYDVISVSYRKVKANCPDFKSHFRSIEQSFVLNITNLNVVFHRQAFLKLKHYCSSIIALRYKKIYDLIAVIRYGIGFMRNTVNDPPVPPGAIKLSYSARINSFVLQLCDKDFDFLELRIFGAESDCIYNANQRMILRAHLRGLAIDDLREITLYPKVMTTDEDGVFDLKYVRHSPKLYSCSDIGSSQDDVKSDGSFRLSVGKINCVLHSEMIIQCRYFLQPFARLFDVLPIEKLKKILLKTIERFRTSATKLHLSIDIQGPTFLFPQNRDNPSVLVFDTGILTIENFFKKNGESRKSDDTDSAESHISIVDNILVKLTSMTISRAIMTLAAVLKMQEPIVEPIQIRLDVKRNTEFRTMLGFQTYGLFEVHGSVDTLMINLGQKDYVSIFNIWEDNITKIQAERDPIVSRNRNPSKLNVVRPNVDDAVVKNLEAFFIQDEQPICEITAKLTFDGLQLNLFIDTDEVLSSPVHDLNNGLGKLTFGEVVTTFDLYSNRSMTTKISLRTCILEDTRKEAAIIRKIIQSPAKSAGMNLESCISVSEPSVFDFTFTQTPTGDKCIDMLVEETRLNLSIPFLLRLTRYFMDSLPHEKIEQGVVNDAFEDHPAVCDDENTEPLPKFQEMPGTSLSIRIRKPEILLFGDLTASNSHAILIQAELTIESSQHTGSSSIVCSLSNLLAKSKSQERYRRQLPQWVLRPCDVEFSINEIEADNRVQMKVDLNSVNIHLSPGIVYTLNEILKEASGIFNAVEANLDSTNENQDSVTHIDLWSPKKVFVVPCKENHPYFINKQRSSRDQTPQIHVLNFKPVSINVSLEMEDTVERIPMIKSEMEIGGSFNSVDDRFQIESTLKIHAFCFNASRGSWEPLIELLTKEDLVYSSWELSIKIYRSEAYRIASCPSITTNHVKKCTSKRKKGEQFDSEDENNEDMIFIRPDLNVPKINRSDYTFEQENDSDSNDDEGTEKLARSFSHLFTNDSSDEEDSESDASSKSCLHDDEGLEFTPEHVVEKNCSAEMSHYPVEGDPLTTHIIVSAEETLNFTLTPNTVSIFETILNTFTKNRAGIPIEVTNAGKLCLQNRIGQMSRIELRAGKENGTENEMRLIAAREYRTTESPASLPSSPETEFFPSGESSQLIVAAMENGFADQQDNTRENSLSTPDILHDDSPMQIYKNLTEENLRIHIDGFDDISLYCPKWQGYKLVPLSPVKHEVRYHVVVEVSTDHHLHRTISVRSPLQIRNETSYALGLYYKKQLVEKLQLPHVGEALNPFDDNMRISVIEPQDTYNVPLYITYHFPIHVLPVHFEKYRVSERGICWKELSDNMHLSKDIYCTSKESNCNSVFGVKVACTGNLNFVRTNCQVPQYVISVVPPLSFDNKLPFVVDISVTSIEYEVRIEPGEKINVYSLKCESDLSVIFKIQNYLGTQWTGTFKLNSELEKRSVKMFGDSESDSMKPFVLCVELNKATSWTVVIYSQYWIINKTGLSLQIQESFSNTVDIPGEELIVFSQKKNRKKLIMVKAHQSDWSLPFSLDAISSMSLIACKDTERKRKYRILAEIATSKLSPQFTKVVTFLPYFYIKNDTKRTLRFMEENEDADLWNDLLPGQGVAFWPYTESMRMRLRWKSSQLVSQHFDVTKIGKIVLRMENGSALCVDVAGGNNSPFIISFQKYQSGDAPVRVDNLCDDLFLKMNQISLGQVALLSPFQSILYTWDDPVEKRELIWNVYNGKSKGYMAQFHTDGYGQEIVTFRTLRRTPLTPTVKKFSRDTRLVTSRNSMSEYDGSNSSSSDDTDSDAETEPRNVEKVRKNRAIVYWISYIEKKQRVLLFTQNENIFLKAKSIVDPECSKREIFCALAGIGLSIVVESSLPDRKSRELAYACIADSSAHWELDIGKRWKTLTLELSAWMEDKYKNSSANAQFENFIDVNFVKMHMTKPFFGKLRRTYSPGVWLHIRKSDTLTYMHGNFHRIQIDNQVQDAVFPIILRSSSKKCFYNHAGSPKLKHSIEFCLLKQRKATYDVYKKINLVVREFHLDLQEEFLMQLARGLFPKRIETKHSIASRLKSDLLNIYVPLPGASDKLSDAKRKTLLEYLHVSPIKLQVKLLASGEELASNYDSMDYCSLIRSMFEYSCKGTFLKSAEFRLPHLKKCGVTVNSKELLLELCQSYGAEMRHQFNVLILSMTVLGNPYSYNFKSPGDYFYDPDTIVIQGDKTAEKLSHDVSCLLGYNSMDGQPASILNFNITDLDATLIKKKRCRFESTETPESMVTVDCSFSMGVELEMWGLIVKPTDNTHQEELRYSLRTLGKSILGLTRSGGDNNSLKVQPGLISDTIKRAQEMGYNFVSRTRFPRYVNPYLPVELYSTYKARGMYLLNIVRKSDYTNEETYWAHASLSNDGRRISLISLQRIYLIEKRCIWGSWTIAWSVEMKELIEAPKVESDKLILRVNKNENISQPSADWCLECKDRTTLEWLCRKINTAMILNVESINFSQRFHP